VSEQKRCRALLCCLDSARATEEPPHYCDWKPEPGAELCWTHRHASTNPDRSMPLELVK